MAAVHCSILHCMCEAIAGIGVETHDLAHPLPTLRVDCTPIRVRIKVRVRIRVRISSFVLN